MNRHHDIGRELAQLAPGASPPTAPDEPAPASGDHEPDLAPDRTTEDTHLAKLEAIEGWAGVFVQRFREQRGELVRVAAAARALDAPPPRPGVLKHGPGGRGGPGPCDPDCAKCRLEAAVGGATSTADAPASQLGRDAAGSELAGVHVAIGKLVTERNRLGAKLGRLRGLHRVALAELAAAHAQLVAITVAIPGGIVGAALAERVTTLARRANERDAARAELLAERKQVLHAGRELGMLRVECVQLQVTSMRLERVYEAAKAMATDLRDRSRLFVVEQHLEAIREAVEAAEVDTAPTQVGGSDPPAAPRELAVVESERDALEHAFAARRPQVSIAAWPLHRRGLVRGARLEGAHRQRLAWRISARKRAVGDAVDQRGDRRTHRRTGGAAVIAPGCCTIEAGSEPERRR